MRQNRILESWNEFAKKVLPKDCSTIQRVEMRRAFYAGVAFIFDRLVRDVSPGDETTPADIKMLEDIGNELQDFARDMMRGAA